MLFKMTPIQAGRETHFEYALINLAARAAVPERVDAIFERHTRREDVHVVPRAGFAELEARAVGIADPNPGVSQSNVPEGGLLRCSLKQFDTLVLGLVSFDPPFALENTDAACQKDVSHCRTGCSRYRTTI
jgi:hypothetical protein